MLRPPCTLRAIAVAQRWMTRRPPDDAGAILYEIAAAADEDRADLTKAIEMLGVPLADPARATSDAALRRARLYIATKQYDKARLALAPFSAHEPGRRREVNALLAKIPPARKR